MGVATAGFQKIKKGLDRVFAISDICSLTEGAVGIVTGLVIAKFKAPVDLYLDNLQASVVSNDGTQTGVVGVLVGGTLYDTAAIATAGTVYEKALSRLSVAKDAEIALKITTSVAITGLSVRLYALVPLVTNIKEV